MFLEKSHSLIFIQNPKINIKPNSYLQYEVLNEFTVRGEVRAQQNLIPSNRYFNELENNYGIYDVGDDFDYIMNSEFYSFFINNSVDIPNYFDQTKSAKRTINNIPLLKFNNYIMRKGLRYKTLKALNSTLYLLINEVKSLKNFTYTTFNSWKDFYILSTTYNYNHLLMFEKNEVLNYGNIQTPNYKNITNVWDLRRLLFANIDKLTSIFSFYIYKVDKQIFKNTRGKSGKYTFIWKYVSPYKRDFLVMFWLLKELRVLQGRSLKDRLFNLLKLFLMNPTKTWAYKVKRFSNNYVYRNCRHTLAEHYRTVKK